MIGLQYTTEALDCEKKPRFDNRCCTRVSIAGPEGEDRARRSGSLKSLPAP